MTTETTTAPLPSQINSPKIEKQIQAAARQRWPRRKKTTVFEHGHWWIIVDSPEESMTFDVVDAVGADCVKSFDFEAVS